MSVDQDLAHGAEAIRDHSVATLVGFVNLIWGIWPTFRDGYGSFPVGRLSWAVSRTGCGAMAGQLG
jgi:hypothetical protein